MVWQHTPYTIPLSVTASLSLLSALYVLRHCHTPSSRTGALLLLSNAVWALGCALELAGADVPTKMFWNKVQYVGIVAGPTAWIVYTLQYTGRERWLTWRALALLSVVPGMLLLLVFTNEAHGLVWAQVTLQKPGPFTVLVKTMGLGFRALATYAYLMILLGTLLFGPALLVRSHHVYPWQTHTLVAAVVAPWLVNAVIDIYDLLPIPRHDLSPLLLGITAPVIAWSLYHLQQESIVPVAYKTIFEGMRDSAIVLDLRNRIVDLNPAAQRLIGRPASEIVGRPIARVWPAWSGEADEMGSEVLFHKEGVQYTFDARTSPLLDWRGRLVSQVLVLRDITARKQAEAALERYTAELERSNQELEQFAYIASHDLQEPLRTVTGYVQLLEMYYKGQLDAAADEYIAFAVDGAARMHALIKGLLDYSRVDTDGGPFRPTDCQAVLDHTLANLQASIKESGACVTHDPLPTVMADAAQLARVFQNLVGNAIKFRGERPPEIHVGAERRDGRSTWLFSVQDNGIGIEPEYAEHIFLIFKRLHTRDEYPGTGIGLAMCKRIVERHGGQIWVESQPGQGSTFHFTLAEGR